ncbi:MAG: PD-(D/E)XK nuclease family protein [Elusimicrobia bacterium]|nr:PD-(D/E)XK nuclease family protein [Candidatus Obscuribacterium magneticum]
MTVRYARNDMLLLDPMLTLVSGPFFPTLENAFLDHLKRESGPAFEKIAVVTPNVRLMERLQLGVARRGISCLNLNFMNFSSIAQNIVEGEEPLPKPVRSDPLFYDTLVKILLKERKPFRRLAEMALPEGFPPAVRSTLRDLIDAGVPPDVTEAIKEKYLGQEVDKGLLLELFGLYRHYHKKMETLPVVHRSVLIKKAAELAPASAYLKSFKEIIYYGFYDLTGLQADFFQAVVKNHPSRLFFPYEPNHPAYEFAKRFREEVLQPVLGEEISLISPSPSAPLFDPTVDIVNVSGLRDEAGFVSGEILRLHREAGIPFHEMAVVARFKERLTSYPALLQSKGIPYSSSFQRSLSSQPQIEVALRFLRSFNEKGRLDEGVARYPEFDTKGSLKIKEGAGGGPAPASWASHAENVVNLLESHFRPATALSRDVWNRLKGAAKELAPFDSIASPVSREDFLETLREKWMGLEWPEPKGVIPGVSLLYAEAARGLLFRAVFLVGVEERVFPRIIREDPFLRDSARLALLNTMGYRIGQKMSALGEERLLFHLMTTSAKDRLCLVTQRTDDGGAFVGMSSYLRAFAQEREIDLEKEVRSIQRPLLKKLEDDPDPFSLQRHEIVAALLAAGQKKSAQQFIAKTCGGKDLLKKALEVRETLDTLSQPHAFDGLIDPKVAANFVNRREISPSSLETYGRCPYQYFATKILRLEPFEKDVSAEEWPTDERGRALHDFFREFYSRLTKTAFSKKLFDEVYESKLGSLQASVVGIHPTLWEAMKIHLKGGLQNFIEEDLKLCSEEGWKPSYFEQTLGASLEPPLDGVDWIGIPDRIDLANGKARVIDYKTGHGFSGKVATEAIRGRRAQAPLYLLLSEKFLKKHKPPVKEISFVYKYLSDKEDGDKELSPADFEANKEAILATIREQIDLMRQGNYLFMKDDYCSYCEVAPICRKNHGLSVYRSQKGPGEKLWKIRKKPVAKSQLKHRHPDVRRHPDESRDPGLC